MTARFKLSAAGTSVRREVIAGATTFATMAYIIIVNPKILESAGLPFGSIMVATILVASLGTIAMGFYANRPFAIAPYIGESAFFAVTVVNTMGCPWPTALGAVFVSGVLLTLLTLLKIRVWLADSIPSSLKISFAVGIGLFLTFVGLREIGVVRPGSGEIALRVGNFHDPMVLLGIGGFLLTGLLMIKRVPAAILIGILAVTGAAFLMGLTPVPSTWISLPPSIAPTLLALDVRGAMSWNMFSIILTLFVMGFVDTLGSLVGLAFRANLLDERGNLPQIERPMLVDALTSTASSLVGTTTSGAYLESATGIAAGGKTGLTAVVTGLLFLSALFVAPFVTAIPSAAYGPSLVIVGLLMMSPITRLHIDTLDDIIPAFAVIALMSFSFNIGIGMTAGFVIHPLFMIFSGRAREIKPGMWVLAGLSVMFYVFYPY